ncbi:MAG: hypothetical protein RL638_228 [Bacteroidota bacterium]|jgi:glycosyltransferase involved in cell wall biosynthesis
MNKICFVITRGDIIGGAQSHLLILCEKFVQNNLEVEVILGGRNTLLSQKLNELGIKTYEIESIRREISPWYDLLSLCVLIKILFRSKPSIVSAHSSKAGLLARIACYILSYPIIFTAHGWAFTEGVNPSKRKIYRQIEYFLAKVSSKIIAVSQYDFDLAINENVCSKEKIELIHNGIIDSNLLRKTKNSEFVRFVMVARFDIPKNHLLLIKAFSELNGVKLYLVGDGPLLNDSINYVRDKGLSEKVEFVGFIENVKEFLTTMDVFILISDYEGFPMSTLEAMSVGLPVVISNVGGATEAVFHGDNGFVVENDVSNIKSAIAQIASDNQLRLEMGVRSRQIFLENFEANIMVSKTLDLFRSVITKK